ncbi:DUF11 domain-containing protein [Thermococcus sp. M36]|uniref:DUF11 domain-containing protein n=1 Tax=Thermococcus sp. M36 TaxID=1638261 RepID=UPI001F109D53|nr:DUF11 domain-containing protein [Thermococcus sp. M36]
MTPMTRIVKSAEVPPYASISAISLGRGDKAVLGQFEVQFVDANLDWSQVYIRITGPEGKSVGGTIGRDGYVSYPSDSDVYLRALVTFIDKYKQSIYLTLQSPLVLIANQTMNEGDTITLPSQYHGIKIKLLDATSVDATFQVDMPDKTRVFQLDEGRGVGLGYPLGNDDFIYSNYVYIELVETYSGGPAKVNVYVPRVPDTSFEVVPKEETPSQPTTISGTVLVYNGLLYVNEQLPVTINNVTYNIKLISTIPDMVLVDVLEGSKKIADLRLEVGDIPKDVPNAPLKLSVQNVEPNYKRAVIRVYAPENAQVTPILREANIAAKIDAIPKEIMVNDNLVLTINVQNLGRGDAYDVSVAAPIPNDFELVSMTKNWNLKTFPAFTNMPALIYVLKPTKVGEFDIGKVMVTFYDDKSLETGKKKIVYSQALRGIKVYGIPKLDVTASAYNGTWSDYITAKAGSKVRLKFTIKASGESPNFEFIKNATLVLNLPSSVDGPSEIPVGTIKAGETKSVQTDLSIISEDLANVAAELAYRDPLGNEHRLALGNLVTINSVPPKVIVKEVKVWPSPEELPSYVEKVLSSTKDPESLARQIISVSEGYAPTTNPWMPLAVVLAVATVVLGGAVYMYRTEVQRLREKMRKKKSRRPGGLPKKAEEEKQESEETSEL